MQDLLIARAGTAKRGIFSVAKGLGSAVHGEVPTRHLTLLFCENLPLHTSILKSCCVLLLVLSFTHSDPVAADAANGPCESADGQRASLGAKECEIVANRPELDRAVVFHDRAVTVQTLRADTSRRGDVVEASLVLNFSAAIRTGRESSGPKSQLRRQTFDCARYTHAIQSSADYSRPAARGEPGAVSRTPDAPMRPTDPASLDARVGAALCAMVKA